MPSDVQIRSAEPRDIETIAELNLAMARETENQRLKPAVLTQGIRTVFDNPIHGFYVVAECEDQVVGCLLITFEWSDWRNGLFWWIQSLYVRPAFRRCGVFRGLYDFVKTEALRRPEVCGLRLYVEQSNHVAQKAYRQMGMKCSTYQLYEEMLKQSRGPQPEHDR
jgi:GNAT superfamily N-acetyltransferase